MKTIWKYTLENDEEEFYMPKSARILNVQIQQDKICFWALVDTDREMDRDKDLKNRPCLVQGGTG